MKHGRTDEADHIKLPGADSHDTNGTGCADRNGAGKTQADQRSAEGRTKLINPDQGLPESSRPTESGYPDH